MDFTKQLNREHKSILFYDLEIKNCIGNEPGYQFCAGWDDFENMGISVIGYCLDTVIDDSRHYIEYGYLKSPDINELDRFFDEAYSKYIVGFNSISFDDNLLTATYNGQVEDKDDEYTGFKTNFDLLREIRIATGQPPFYVKGVTQSGYSLDNLAATNLGYRKTGNGALAPKLWQDGKHEEVINYCMNDIKLLVDLYWLFMQGNLQDPNTGKFIEPVKTNGNYLEYQKAWEDM